MVQISKTQLYAALAFQQQEIFMHHTGEGAGTLFPALYRVMIIGSD
jgi:hypothetical protein